MAATQETAETAPKKTAPAPIVSDQLYYRAVFFRDAVQIGDTTTIHSALIAKTGTGAHFGWDEIRHNGGATVWLRKGQLLIPVPWANCKNGLLVEP